MKFTQIKTKNMASINLKMLQKKVVQCRSFYSTEQYGAELLK